MGIALGYGDHAPLAGTCQFPSGNFWLALLIAPLVIAALGWLVETLLFRRVYRRDASYQLLLTYGLVLMGSDTVS